MEGAVGGMEAAQALSESQRADGSACLQGRSCPGLGGRPWANTRTSLSLGLLLCSRGYNSPCKCAQDEGGEASVIPKGGCPSTRSPEEALWQGDLRLAAGAEGAEGCTTQLELLERGQGGGWEYRFDSQEECLLCVEKWLHG